MPSLDAGGLAERLLAALDGQFETVFFCLDKLLLRPKRSSATCTDDESTWDSLTGCLADDPILDTSATADSFRESTRSFFARSVCSAPLSSAAAITPDLTPPE